MVTSDPSAPLPVLIGIICLFAIIVIKDEFKVPKEVNN
jgi:hypothetical protein